MAEISHAVASEIITLPQDHASSPLMLAWIGDLACTRSLKTRVRALAEMLGLATSDLQGFRVTPMSDAWLREHDIENDNRRVDDRHPPRG